MAALLAASALALSGCVPAIAAGAAGAAARSVQGAPQSNAHLRPAAVAACTERAAPYGKVHVIDVEQRAADRLVVWGTAGEGAAKRSFECAFGTAVTSFKLREIRPR